MPQINEVSWLISSLKMFTVMVSLWIVLNLFTENNYKVGMKSKLWFFKILM